MPFSSSAEKPADIRSLNGRVRPSVMSTGSYRMPRVSFLGPVYVEGDDPSLDGEPDELGTTGVGELHATSVRMKANHVHILIGPPFPSALGPTVTARAGVMAPGKNPTSRPGPMVASRRAYDQRNGSWRRDAERNPGPDGDSRRLRVDEGGTGYSRVPRSRRAFGRCP